MKYLLLFLLSLSASAITIKPLSIEQSHKLIIQENKLLFKHFNCIDYKGNFYMLNETCSSIYFLINFDTQTIERSLDYSQKAKMFASIIQNAKK